jgi:hypothetical protein
MTNETNPLTAMATQLLSTLLSRDLCPPCGAEHELSLASAMLGMACVLDICLDVMAHDARLVMPRLMKNR